MAQITLLKTTNKEPLHKAFSIKNGEIIKKSEVSAGRFTSRVVSFDDLSELARIIKQCSQRGDEMAIRGTPISLDDMLAKEAERVTKMETYELTGRYLSRADKQPLVKVSDSGKLLYHRRRKALVSDEPLSWVMFDVDGFTPSDNNWRTHPSGAAAEVISKVLGAPFVGKECLFIFSASQGTDSKTADGIDRDTDTVKAHLFFMLDESVTTAQWEAWAQLNDVAVDKAVFRVVQPHFIANPRFSGGHQDPCKVFNVPRGLLLNKTGGDVKVEALKLGEVAYAVRKKLSRAASGEQTDDYMDVIGKPGWEGSFNATYSITDVLLEYVGEWFEIESDGEHVSALESPTGARGNCMIYGDVKLWAGSSGVSWQGEKRNAYELCLHYLHGGDRDACDAWCASLDDVVETYHRRLDEAFSDAADLDLGDDEIPVAKEDKDTADPTGAAMDKAEGIIAQMQSRADLTVKADLWKQLIVAALHVGSADRSHLFEETFERCKEIGYRVGKRELRTNWDKAIKKAADQLAEKRGKKELPKPKGAELLELGADDLAQIAADRFIENIGGRENMLYANKRFYDYEAGVWSEIPEAVMVRSVEALTRAMRTEAHEAFLASGGDDVFRFIPAVRLMNETVSLLRAMLGADFSVFKLDGSDPERDRVMIVNNARLEIGLDGKVVAGEHRRDDYALNKYPVNYVPGGADSIGAACPGVDAMLWRIFDFVDERERQGVIDCLWELIGYGMQLNKRVPMWVLFLGSGKNGKTSLAKLFTRIVGVANIAFKSINDFSGQNKHIMMSLLNKVMFIDDDVDHNTVLPDGVLKKISETKPVEADPKGRDVFTFMVKCTPLMLSNGYPSIRDLSDGMRRRAVVVPLKTRFSDNGSGRFSVDDFAQSEIDGAFMKALAGLVRFMRRGWQLPDNAVLDEAKSVWLNNANPIYAFCDYCIEDDLADSDSVTLVQDIYHVYESWYLRHYATNRGMKGKRQFIADIESMGRFKVFRLNTRDHRNAVAIWGIRVIDDNSDVMD